MDGLNMKITYSVRDMMSALCMSRAYLYKIINSGELRTYMVGKRRYCTHQAIIDFQHDMEKKTAKKSAA